MPNLLAYFEFLCAFVPQGGPFYPNNGEPPREATVLLCDLREPNLSFQNQGSHEEMEPHFPFLRFDQRDREELGADDRAFNLERGNAKAILFNGEEVTIHPDGQTLARALRPNNGTPSDVHQPTNEDEEKLLWWGVGMERVDAQHTLVKRALINNPGPHDPPLAARIHLTTGDFLSGELTAQRWRLGPGVEQIIAVSLLLQVSFENFVEFRFTPLGPGETKRLRLKPRAGLNSVEVRIKNSEEEFIFEDDHGDMADPDLDFEHYYRMTPPPGSPSTGLPVIPLPSLPQNGSNGACSPALFQGAASQSVLSSTGAREGE